MAEVNLRDVVVRKAANNRISIEFPGDISEGFPGVPDGGEVSVAYVTAILARVANAKVDAEGCIGNVGCKDCWW